MKGGATAELLSHPRGTKPFFPFFLPAVDFLFLRRPRFTQRVQSCQVQELTHNNNNKKRIREPELVFIASVSGAMPKVRTNTKMKNSRGGVVSY